MYSRILVPLDGTERAAAALTPADRLAGRFEAELTVASFIVDVGETDEQERIITEQVDRLEHRHHSLLRTVAYTVADEIAFELERHPDTLVVMATKARSHTAPVLGSVADELLTLSGAPTLLLGSDVQLGPDWPDGRVLVCTDGSDESETVLPAAAQWTTSLDLDPWIVTVAEPEAARIPTGVGDVGRESSAVNRVARRLDALTGSTADFEVLHGKHAAHELTDYATRTGAGLIAMSTQGESGFRRIVVGSVAMEVVHRAPCPVLVVPPRPAGD